MDIGRNDAMYEQNNGSSSSLHDVGLEDQRPGGLSDEVHDQLPTVDEYKASQGSSGASSAQLKARLTMGILIMVGCIILMIGIAVGNRKNAARSSYNGFQGYHDHHTSRGKEIAAFVVNNGWATLSATSDKMSAQSKAIHWMAEEDPMRVSITHDQEFMQRYLLSTIYYALDGPAWAHETNFLSGRETCNWNNMIQGLSKVNIEIGVSCRSGQNIKQIFLPKLGLKGTLPEEFGYLLSLEDLNLFQNHITGSIPEGWKRLTHLKTLILHDNKIGGNLPIWISSLPLKTLNLASNRFVGEVPTLSEMQLHLETLSLENNSFQGSLEFLSKVRGVRAIYLGNNKFSGPITDQLITHFRALEILDASDNQLTGPLPSDLLVMDSLIVVDLHGNKLEGHLPDFVVIGSPLKFLALQGNRIHGPIGAKLDNFKELEHLDLSENFFTGPMPTQLGSLKKLRYLYLAFNTNLEAGPIPESITTLPLLKDLSLQKTNRNGEIPYRLIDNEDLQMLDLNDNKLSGSIPEELSRLENLQFILLKNNMLTGSLPTQLGRLTTLDTLLVDDNDFSGATATLCQLFGNSVKTFVADCADLSDECPCCTLCCSDDETSCNDVVWFSDLDPIAEGNYGRTDYVFREADIVYDAPKGTETPSFYQNFTGYSFKDMDYKKGQGFQP